MAAGGVIDFNGAERVVAANGGCVKGESQIRCCDPNTVFVFIGGVESFSRI